eukprot:m.166780 g.166780  ORF g.166780 m.166780 type:complete len:164 (-) comp18169_c0_seq2:226-717(-)
MAESRTSVSESPSRPSMRSRKTTPAEKDSARFDDAVAKKEERQETHNRRFDGSTIVWLLLCIGVIHKFDIIDAVRYDPRINRESLQLAAVLMAVSIAVAAYSIVFVHGVLGKDYLDHSPWVSFSMCLSLFEEKPPCAYSSHWYETECTEVQEGTVCFASIMPF